MAENRAQNKEPWGLCHPPQHPQGAPDGAAGGTTPRCPHHQNAAAGMEPASSATSTPPHSAVPAPQSRDIFLAPLPELISTYKALPWEMMAVSISVMKSGSLATAPGCTPAVGVAMVAARCQARHLLRLSPPAQHKAPGFRTHGRELRPAPTRQSRAAGPTAWWPRWPQMLSPIGVVCPAPAPRPAQLLPSSCAASRRKQCGRYWGLAVLAACLPLQKSAHTSETRREAQIVSAGFQTHL